jgi:hypothetical protein
LASLKNCRERVGSVRILIYRGDLFLPSQGVTERHGVVFSTWGKCWVQIVVRSVAIPTADIRGFRHFPPCGCQNGISN